ncbi:hypothetical protein CsSME_00031337 [Camellia sinensis var. sinensis]
MSLTSRLKHVMKPNALRSYLADFISTFLFVFATALSTMSSWKMMMMPDFATDLSALGTVMVANVFSLSVAVYAMANISIGHVNPAATFGMAVIRGHISVPMAILYWISQLVGSVMACLFLKVTTVAQHHVPIHGIPQEMTGFGASILERVMTFGLVYTVYAPKEPRRAIGPLAIKFIVRANVLSFGPYMGGLMNPTYSFGSALVGGSFKNHAVYWVGPLIGSALAGILYDNVVFPIQLPSIADGVGV